MTYIINPFMEANVAGGGGGGGSTTKITVGILEFDENDDCSCSIASYETWEDSMDEAGGGLEPSIGDIISDGSSCAQVTALNATASYDRYTADGYSSCEECNAYLLLCETY